MKKFKDFVLELYHAPIISVEKHHNDISNEETINEINKNLSIALSVNFPNIEQGFDKAKKVLSMYGLELPSVKFKDEKKGSVNVPIAQKYSSGESIYDVTAPFQEKSPEKHYFVFSYVLEDGTYDIFAEVRKK